jgi:hypothetical protein
MIVPTGALARLVSSVLNLDDSPRALMAISAIATAAVIAFFLGGPHMMVLVLGATILLLAIFALWNSVRSLTGELEVDPALVQAQNQFVSARNSEKERVLRALKDLENERDIGKLDEADFKAVSARYREEAKDLLREMDAEVAPHRAKAEELAAKYLKKHLEDAAADTKDKDAKSKKNPSKADEVVVTSVVAREVMTSVVAREVVTSVVTKTDGKTACPSCEVMNDSDAKFCKSCAAPMKKDVIEDGAP